MRSVCLGDAGAETTLSKGDSAGNREPGLPGWGVGDGLAWCHEPAEGYSRRSHRRRASRKDISAARGGGLTAGWDDRVPPVG